jgi:ABC-type branched-subunit amino acid transport system ATPase component
MLLAVDHLDVHYGRAKVLHDINVRVGEGELVCLVGRYGAGKTTLLKTIGGFIKPSKGSILFRDTKIDGWPPEKVALKGIRYVFQDKRVFGELTVRDHIELAAFPTKEKVDQAIERLVGIHPKMGKLLDSKAKGLSGGERQILLIGRALIGNPELLLIDEPTEGLAAIIISEIARILREVKSKISMIVVEQNLSVVANLADRIYVMKEGAIFREITEQAVIKQPALYECDL